MSYRKYSVLPVEKQMVHCRTKNTVLALAYKNKKTTENYVKTGSKSIKIKTGNF